MNQFSKPNFIESYVSDFHATLISTTPTKYCGGFAEYRTSISANSTNSLDAFFKTSQGTIKQPSHSVRLQSKRKSLALNAEAEESLKKRLDETIAKNSAAKIIIYTANDPRETRMKCRDIYKQLEMLDVEYKTVDFTGKESKPNLQREYDRMCFQIRMARTKMCRGQLQGRDILPQIFYKREYRGSYDEFDSAVRGNKVREFLDIPEDRVEVEDEIEDEVRFTTTESEEEVSTENSHLENMLFESRVRAKRRASLKPTILNLKAPIPKELTEPSRSPNPTRREPTQPPRTPTPPPRTPTPPPKIPPPPPREPTPPPRELTPPPPREPTPPPPREPTPPPKPIPAPRKFTLPPKTPKPPPSLPTDLSQKLKSITLKAKSSAADLILKPKKPPQEAPHSQTETTAVAAKKFLKFTKKSNHEKNTSPAPTLAEIKAKKAAEKAAIEEEERYIQAEFIAFQKLERRKAKEAEREAKKKARFDAMSDEEKKELALKQKKREEMLERMEAYKREFCASFGEEAPSFTEVAAALVDFAKLERLREAKISEEQNK